MLNYANILASSYRHKIDKKKLQTFFSLSLFLFKSLSLTFRLIEARKKTHTWNVSNASQPVIPYEFDVTRIAERWFFWKFYFFFACALFIHVCRLYWIFFSSSFFCTFGEFFNSIVRWCSISFKDNVSDTGFSLLHAFIWAGLRSSFSLFIWWTLMNKVCIRNHLLIVYISPCFNFTESIGNLTDKTTPKYTFDVVCMSVCLYVCACAWKWVKSRSIPSLRYFTFHLFLPCTNKILHSFCMVQTVHCALEWFTVSSA